MSKHITNGDNMQSESPPKTTEIMGKWSKISAIIGGVGGFIYFPATLVFSDVSWTETILVTSFIAPMSGFLGTTVGWMFGGVAGFVYSVITKAELDIDIKINPHHPVFEKSSWIPYMHTSYNGTREVRYYNKYAIMY